MSYLAVTDFKFGMDRRRQRVAGVPGTLWTLKNGHITRGGDVERAKKFVTVYTLPEGTFGLAAVRGQLYTFGSADLATFMPNGVQYQRLQAPSTLAMVDVLDVRAFDGQLYVVAEYACGNIHHFYNGVRVTDWDTIVDSATDAATLAQYMADKLSGDPDVFAIASGALITITARVPGTAFAISKSTVNGGAVNDQDIVLTTSLVNVPAVAEARAAATVTITGGSAGLANAVTALSLNGTPLISGLVYWKTSNASTAIRLAAAINAGSTTHGYDASVIGATVTIKAPSGTGSTPNGYVLAHTVGGNLTVTTSGTMSGGVTAVSAVAQVVTAEIIGTFEPTDRFTITINTTSYAATGRAAATGTSVFIFKKRLWSTAGSLWRYSKLSDPTDWTDASASTGAGFINMSNETEGTERLVGAAEYDGSGAVFSRRSIRIVTLDTDAELISLEKSIPNTGTFSPRSVLPYSNTDVFYLDPSGNRSLRARDSSNVPTSDDIGTAIDSFVLEYAATLTDAQIAKAVAIVEPRERRPMLAIGEYIFVLSQYPRSKITAWSYYDPGFSVTDFATIDRRLYARAGNTIYCYGGEAGTTYPDANEQIVKVHTPFMTSDKIATLKMYTGFDAALTNVWDTYLLVDPNDDTKKIHVGRMHRTTYHEQNVTLDGRSSHAAIEMECSAAGSATISSFAIHFGNEEAN